LDRDGADSPATLVAAISESEGLPSMIFTTKPWFAVGSFPEGRIRCVICKQEIDATGLTGDHHPRVCPFCGTECMFLDWKGRPVQIVPENAPPPLARLLRWTQENLDELEFTELLVHLESFADAVNTPSGSSWTHEVG
jgi:hypothetical protein